MKREAAKIARACIDNLFNKVVYVNFAISPDRLENTVLFLEEETIPKIRKALVFDSSDDLCKKLKQSWYFPHKY